MSKVDTKSLVWERFMIPEVGVTLFAEVARGVDTVCLSADNEGARRWVLNVYRHQGEDSDLTLDQFEVLDLTFIGSELDARRELVRLANARA